MHISNPITPRSTEVRQQIVRCRIEIKKIRALQENAPAALTTVHNESLTFWFTKLNKLEQELACLS